MEDEQGRAAVERQVRQRQFADELRYSLTAAVLQAALSSPARIVYQDGMIGTYVANDRSTGERYRIRLTVEPLTG